MDGFIMEFSLLKWMILGDHHFRNPPYINILPPDSPISIAPFWIQICGYVDRFPLRWSIGLVIRHQRSRAFLLHACGTVSRRKPFFVAYLPPINGKLRKGDLLHYHSHATCEAIYSSGPTSSFKFI